MKYFLVGIKGTGMCALAKILKDMGLSVFGSDCEEVFFTDEILIKNKIKYYVFNENNIKEDYIYIISSCYNDENVEVKKIKENQYKYYYYNEFIECFFKNKIGVGGVHGKTTTTAFITDLFCDKKISSLVGDGVGLGMNEYDYFIFEACEYRNHILSYNFEYLIITNIDIEHLDYFKNIDEIYQTFIKASQNSKYLIINENIKINHPNKYTFGKDKDNYCYYEIIKEDCFGYKLKIIIDSKSLTIDFPYYGKHMIYNLLASITVYYLIYKELDNLQKKINNFRKINRRMNEYLYNKNIIIDDYAHHPTEIKALLMGIKQKYKEKKINVIFQPHTYSRTLNLINEFNESFKLCDRLLLMNTFTSKRETYNQNLEIKVFDSILNKEKYTDAKLNELLNEENNIIIFLGAGNFNKYIEKIRE